MQRFVRFLAAIGVTTALAGAPQGLAAALQATGPQAAAPHAAVGLASAPTTVTLTPPPSPPATGLVPPDGSAPANIMGDAAPTPPIPSQPAVPPPVAAPTPATPTSADADPGDDAAPLQAVAQTVDKIRARAAHAVTDDSLAQLRQQAAAAQADAGAYAAARARALADLDLKLKRLSTASGAARSRLTALQQKERSALIARRTRLTGQIQAARTAVAAASETYDAVSNKRRTSFDSKVFERTASPLEASFWTSLLASLPPDTDRLLALGQDAVRTALDAPEPRGVLSVLGALAIAFLIAGPARSAIKAFGRRRAAAATGTASRFQRSAHAVIAVVIDTALPGATAGVVNLGLIWGQVIADKTEALAQALVIAVFWGAAILALSRQLAGDPKHRLLSVSERLAAHMRLLPWLVALITGAGFLINRVNSVVGASLAATIAANCILSLAYAAVACLVLVALGVDQDKDEAEAKPAAVKRAPGRTLVSLALGAAIVVTLGAVFAGFTTFAALVSSQIFWISVLVAGTYLLLRFVDDAVIELFKPHGWIGRVLTAILNLRVATVDQLGVLTSAVLQVLIVLGALSLALTPFGRNGELLGAHFAHIGQAVHLGSLTISPRSVATGVISLVAGLAFVHLVERWVDNRFLPVTDWDAGVRNSVSTGVRYVGIGVALLWALAAAGLGFKQIALVASALSVGIGFGLQQIVQNFVSGLILLVERPVKVGDWVNVGGVEGDVRRIRVRATEIQTFDRTTLIVPNSDLITKAVQNKTLGDPHGRVKLEFTIGAAADAPRACTAIEAVLAQDGDVLHDPKPNVFIDGLTATGAVNYVCYAYVASPRDAYRVRSRLYAEVIGALGEARIGFVGGPTLVVVEPGPELRTFVNDLAAARPAPSA